MAAADELDPSSSVLAFFATEVRRVRTEAGMSQADLAKRVYLTRSLLCKIEAATRVPSEDLAERLDDVFETGKHFQRLWPLVIKHAYPPWFRPFVELEEQAEVIQAFENQVVPGLLQTENYARAILEAGPLDNVEELLAARMVRQRILDRETPPQLWVVLDENVLRRMVGGPVVMREQYARLIEAAESRRNVIQIVPYEAGAHAGLGPFWVLSFDEGADVVYEEGAFEGRLLADPTNVKAARRAYDLLKAVALSPQASIDMIAKALKELDP